MIIKKILPLLLLILIGCSEPINKVDLNYRNEVYYSKDTNQLYTGKVVSFYPDGQIFEEETLKNGKANGLYKVYYPNGQLLEEGTYIDGISNGLFKKYYKSGQLESERYWKNGRSDGHWKFYYEHGTLEKWIIYENGKVISKSPFFSFF